jgi:hypothetical protein
MERLIAHSNILSQDPIDELKFLGDKNYHYSEATLAVLDMSDNMPHLADIYKAFLSGALETWLRFTSEFEIGGDIDLATTTDREDAWMPPTNDANEGALGSLRIAMRENPNMSLHLIEAKMKYRKNDTQAFMDSCLLPADHKWLMKEARRIDSLGLEHIRADNQRKHDQVVEEMTREKAKAKALKQAELTARLNSVILVQDPDTIKELTNKALDEQLAVYRRVDNSVPKVSKLKVKSLKVSALLEAVDRSKNCLEPQLDGPLQESGQVDVECGGNECEEDADEEQLY